MLNDGIVHFINEALEEVLRHGDDSGQPCQPEHDPEGHAQLVTRAGLLTLVYTWNRGA